jgi:hypothetical protein
MMPAQPSARSSAPIASCVRWLATLVLAATLFAFILALPPFAYGIWFQTEPVTAGVLGAGAVAGVLLILLDLTGHPVGAALCRRSMLTLGVFIAWNAVASVFQPLPERSWFGTPETGEGVLCYIALWALALLAIVIWPYRWPRIGLAAASGLAALILAASDTLLPMGSPWRPQLVAGYAGTIGPAVVLIIAAVTRWPNRRLIWFGVAVALPIVLSSFIISQTDGRYLNRSAVIFAFLLAPTVFFPLRFTLLRLPPRAARLVAAGMPLMALLVVAAMLLPSAFVNDVTWLYSLRSRALLVLAAWQGMAEHAGNWLWGTGWGSYNDLLFRHSYLAGVTGFRDGVWHPDWEALGAGAFNSHSAVIEALTGGGVPGAILYLLVVCTIVRDGRRPLLAGSAVVWLLILAALCVWYPFLMSFPFIALTIAATIAPPRPPMLRRPRWWPSLLGLGMTALLGWGAQATIQDARDGGRLLAMLNRQDATDLAGFKGQPPDHGRGGVHLWWVALNYTAFLSDRAANHQPITMAQAGWFERLLQEVDRWTAEGRAGLRLSALTASMRNEVEAVGDVPALNAVRLQQQPKWRDAVMAVLRQAPLRTDIAAPYLTWLASEQRYMPMLSFCGRVFSLRPNDPVCLWFGGYALLSDTATEADGILQMRDALTAGVQRIAPITDQAREQVEKRAAALVP